MDKDSFFLIQRIPITGWNKNSLKYSSVVELYTKGSKRVKWSNSSRLWCGARALLKKTLLRNHAAINKIFRIILLYFWVKMITIMIFQRDCTGSTKFFRMNFKILKPFIRKKKFVRIPFIWWRTLCTYKNKNKICS